MCCWRRSACFSRRGFSPSSALPCARASYRQEEYPTTASAAAAASPPSFGIVILAIAVFGGRAWWNAEAFAYADSVLYRPFASAAAVKTSDDGARVLSLTIDDRRWPPTNPGSRYNALIPDHGKLMHMFMIRDGDLGALRARASRSAFGEGRGFRRDPSAAAGGQYRVYGDIVHESGYAQTLVASATLDGSPGIATGARPGRFLVRRQRGAREPHSVAQRRWHGDHLAARRAPGRRCRAAADLYGDQCRWNAGRARALHGHDRARRRRQRRGHGLRAPAPLGQHRDGRAAEVCRRRRSACAASGDDWQSAVDSLRVSPGREVSAVDTSETRRPRCDRRVRCSASVFSRQSAVDSSLVTGPKTATDDCDCWTADSRLQTADCSTADCPDCPTSY